MDQQDHNNGGGEEEQQRGEGLRPNRRISSKIPRYDPAESVEQYLNLVDYWFELEAIQSEQDKFRTLLPRLPPNMFSEAHNANLSSHAAPFTELRRLLVANFDLNETERVRKLTEAVQLGKRRPGAVLRDMQQLAVTTDERVLKNLWLQRLPPDLGAALSTSLDLPGNG